MGQLQNILYVEDDQETCNIVKRVFDDSQYNLVVCQDVYSALDEIENQRPDLAVFDVQLKGDSGIHLLQVVREKGHDFPVVFCTAQATPEDLLEYEQLKLAGVITKPFKPEEFIPKLEEIWSHV